jgi:hypothetical protein
VAELEVGHLQTAQPGVQAVLTQFQRLAEVAAEQVQLEVQRPAVDQVVAKDGPTRQTLEQGQQTKVSREATFKAVESVVAVAVPVPLLHQVPQLKALALHLP